ncbi:MAG: branched-chain amino acid ABC transporter permease [Deltaproteobacteria bacterium]|nr:branched-chain amino acid ABC transporter permease [Deltaproteobacteria bacterium]
MPSAPQLLQYVISGTTVGSTYGLTALGFTMIYNTTDIVNFAQGEFVMLGGMLAVFAMRWGHLPLPAAVLLSVVAVTALGVVVDRLTIRPVRSRSVLSLIIITVAVSILLRGGAMLLFGKDTFPLPPFTGGAPVLLAGATVLPQNLWVLGIALATLGSMKLFFDRTIVGKAMLACAFDAQAASLMGIHVAGMVTLSFALSALVGSLGGVILAPLTLTSYDAGVLLGLKGFAACILGGLGNPFGAVAGGMLLGTLEALGAGLVSSGYKDALAFIILLALLFVRPSGLFGKKLGERV